MKKIVKENLYERFSIEGDPIHDMEIGLKPIETAYDFGDELVRTFRRIDFDDAELTAVGKTKRKNLYVEVEVENSPYEFELTSKNNVILRKQQIWGVYGPGYIKVNKKLGRIGTEEFEENLKNYFI